MLDRRQMIITSAGALTMTTAPGLVPLTVADDYDRTWMHELHWQVGNRDDGHQWPVRAPLSQGHTIFQIHSDYGDMPAYGLDNAVFHGQDWRGRIHGLSDYYNTRDTTKAQNAINVLDAGDRGPYLTSVWFVTWSERTVSLITPDGQPVDPHVNSKMALAIKDWRYAARVANLDFFRAHKEPELAFHQMIRAENCAPWRYPNSSAFYISSTLTIMWHERGLMRPDIHGIPIRGVNALNQCEKVI